jgi:S1-C subfamily serine protease
VEPDSPAASAGIASGDVILALDQEPVAGVDDLVRLLNGERIGRSVTLRLLRQGSVREVSVTPSERTAPRVKPQPGSR